MAAQEDASSQSRDYIKLPSADKALVFTVPYLLLLTYCFYAGYWGTLNVDIYPYLQIQDIVNGAANALRWPLASIIICTTMIITVNLLLVFIMRVLRIPWLVYVSITIIVISIIAILIEDSILPIFHFIKGVPYSEPSWGVFLTNWSIPTPVVNIILLSATFVVQWIMHNRYPNMFHVTLYENKKGDERVKALTGIDFWPYIWHYTSLINIVAIPMLAFATGYYDAKAILDNKRFDYIENKQYASNALLSTHPYLKYLGKAGETYFLLSPDNKERVTLTTDSLGTVLLRNSGQLRKMAKHR